MESTLVCINPEIFRMKANIFTSRNKLDNKLIDNFETYKIITCMIYYFTKIDIDLFENQLRSSINNVLSSSVIALIAFDQFIATFFSFHFTLNFFKYNNGCCCKRKHNHNRINSRSFSTAMGSTYNIYNS